MTTVPWRRPGRKDGIGRSGSGKENRGRRRRWPWRREEPGGGAEGVMMHGKSFQGDLDARDIDGAHRRGGNTAMASQCRDDDAGKYGTWCPQVERRPARKRSRRVRFRYKCHRGGTAGPYDTSWTQRRAASPPARRFQLAVAGDPPDSTVQTRETGEDFPRGHSARPAPRCCDDRWPAPRRVGVPYLSARAMRPYAMYVTCVPMPTTQAPTTGLAV
ncbi:hypothetical protein E2562_000018 [Oryza meyeriana var. granulata]|uniref:Uncharacterized protein n=1 Tax=Oryza meyeriana var. granulata TaxID=110450 RepID=A0A6G1DB66_9ORYZ|nr:hypothetical protein E2562_000018 [Oryza meyeriana var. granulata]